MAKIKKTFEDGTMKVLGTISALIVISGGMLGGGFGILELAKNHAETKMEPIEKRQQEIKQDIKEMREEQQEMKSDVVEIKTILRERFGPPRNLPTQ